MSPKTHRAIHDRHARAGIDRIDRLREQNRNMSNLTSQQATIARDVDYSLWCLIHRAIGRAKIIEHTASRKARQTIKRNAAEDISDLQSGRAKSHLPQIGMQLSRRTRGGLKLFYSISECRTNRSRYLSTSSQRAKF